MRLIFAFFILSSCVCFSSEDNGIEMGLKDKIPLLLSGTFINPCYKQKKMAFSKYYKFSYSMGKVTKYTSPDDKNGKEHPGHFISLANFIDTAAGGGGKSGMDAIGICTGTKEQVNEGRSQRYEEKLEQEFYNIVGASFSDCDCSRADRCDEKKNDLLSLKRRSRSCLDVTFGFCSDIRDPQLTALQNYFISKCYLKEKKPVEDKGRKKRRATGNI